ncbi:hypothetical protein E2986_08609 [Frieseomelitta varia]|uniref:Uncharacterized protein n=1 Tax=Frieseomelitta varia TaxID=561572 RepID=A0A833RUF5_9HYME|nr:hypothetical protein E2986_08609 [Frieseomelitta varia]
MSGNDDVADPTNVRSENEYREWIIEVKLGENRFTERELHENWSLQAQGGSTIGPDACKSNERGYEAVELIYRELTSAYKQSEIDWKIIHDAGCTRDDTDLPHHVTAPNDLDRLISGTFRSFLTALPVPPTIVTIARSSNDDYCPPENVDQIQIGVLDELRQYLGEVDVQLAYEDEEEVH